MAAEINRLLSVSAVLRRQRDEESKSLTRILNNANPSDVRELGPAVLSVLDSVRRSQPAPGAPDNPATGNRPTCERLSANSFRCSGLSVRTASAR
jgi:hypothetical protein